jgi:Holliday junction resolvase-like predicted endonuclease
MAKVRDNTGKGAIHEFKACIYLMEQGYEVFLNVKGAGPADLVAWHPETNEILVIDVKTIKNYPKTDGTASYHSSLGSDKNKKPFVTYLGYCASDDFFEWL